MYIGFDPQRGIKTFNNFLNFLFTNANYKVKPGTSLLDFGCGSGSFLYTAIKAGLSAYGVDCDPSVKAEYDKLTATDDPSYIDRYIIYDGNFLPFESSSFDIVFSWYVLEHIQNIDYALKEMVRVLKPGGLMALFTQDARGAYDGHVKIPWPPFLHPLLYEFYLDEFGWEEIFENRRRAVKKETMNKVELLNFMKAKVFYVTEPHIVATLKYFNMKIVFSQFPDVYNSSVIQNIATPEDARKAAEYFKIMRRTGKWKIPQGIKILAMK